LAQDRKKELRWEYRVLKVPDMNRVWNLKELEITNHQEFIMSYELQPGAKRRLKQGKNH